MSEGEPPEITVERLGRLLAMLVHDLRNPAATVGANLGFLRNLNLDDSADRAEAPAAIADSEEAITELLRGLDAVAVLARALGGEARSHDADGDVRDAMQVAARRAGFEVQVEFPVGPLRARGGGTLARILDILLANAALYAPKRSVSLRAHREGDRIVVEQHDDGRAIELSLRSVAFSLAGQELIKGRADGRYGRFAGLVVARILADGIGAKLDADGHDGDAIFRVSLRSP